jgi:4-hydroxybenzoate polyprenyltransferase
MSEGISKILPSGAGGQFNPVTSADVDRWDTKPSQKGVASFGDYISLARFDHCTKHIFIIPGLVIAYLLRGVINPHPMWHAATGIVTAISIASANYVINEWLDRDFDRHHPTKHKRASVQRDLSRYIVLAEWIGFVVIGLTAAALSSRLMLGVATIFALQGVVYNVSPIRTKDKAYLDVISESINNPLRLLIGWAIIDATTLPPISIILTYWCGGAFLMAAKRLSEYREIVATQGRDLLIRYRASFRGYDEIALHVSCLSYGLLATFFTAVFLIKYRIEYLLIMPIIVLLFAQYLSLSMRAGSSAQNPEKLYRERRLMFSLVALGLVFLVTTFTNIPEMGVLLDERFITLR